MNRDIATLLREALIENGIDNSVLGTFDSHSTISLDFNDSPSLLVNAIDGDVWLWTRLAEYSPQSLAQCSAALLEKLMQGCDFTTTGQLQLSESEGYIELKAMVHCSYLESSSGFAEALNGFFDAMRAFSAIYTQGSR